MKIVPIFVRLKLRIIVNGLKASTTRALLMALASIMGVVVGLAGAWTIAQQRFNPQTSGFVLISAFTVGFVGWIVIPMVAFGTDDTLDASKLTSMPLRNHEMLLGMAAAALVGVPAAVTALIFSGAVFGYSPGNYDLVFTIAGVATEIALCIVGSRAVVTEMASLLRSRRGKDMGVIVLSFICTSYFFLRVLVGQAATSLGRNGGGITLTSVLRWSPPGMAAQAIVEAQHRRTGAAALTLVGALAWLLAFGFWWSWGLRRASVSTDRSHSSSAAADRRPIPLFPRYLRAMLPKNEIGAVAARELRYATREPRRRTMIVQSVVLGLIVPLSTTAIHHGRHPGLVFAAAAVPAMICLNSLNSLGMDGPALWMDIAASDDLDGVLRGKNLTQGVLAVLVTIPVALVLAAVEHGWGELPFVLASAICATGVVIGIGNIASVVAPIPIPDSTHNAFASAGGGRGCVTAAIQGVSMVGVAVFLGPCAYAMWISSNSGIAGYRYAASLGVIAYGMLCWSAGMSVAKKFVTGREIELLEAIAPRNVA